MKIGYLVKINQFVSMNSSFRATYISYMYPIIRKIVQNNTKWECSTESFSLRRTFKNSLKIPQKVHQRRTDNLIAIIEVLEQ